MVSYAEWSSVFICRERNTVEKKSKDKYTKVKGRLINIIFRTQLLQQSWNRSKPVLFVSGQITSLDSQDKSNAFTNSELPNSYVNNNEPQVQPGQNKGLYLMLDAHSDLFSASSVDSDIAGFIGLIHPKGAFPFTMLEGFNIRPGTPKLAKDGFFLLWFAVEYSCINGFFFFFF